MTEGRPDPREPVAPTYPADKARQADIVLRTRWQRIIFIAGLVACGVVALFAPVLLR